MIDILTRAFTRPWPPIWRPLCAKLSGVSGFTGRGVVLYQNKSDDLKKLSIELQGLAGIEAELFADDETTAIVPLANGRASATFTSKHGCKLPSLGDGSRIDIRQNGEIILSGVLSRK